MILCFWTCLFIQAAFWFWIFRPLAGKPKLPESELPLQSVSVIICARNELENLRNNLPAILEQDYPDFEVILIDDDSDDDSLSYLNALGQHYKNLRVYKMEPSERIYQGKKSALAKGIAMARYEWALLTDADCKPRSNNWIKSMMNHLISPGIEIVLGAGPYTRTDNGLLQGWIQYETLLTAIQYLGLAANGYPYMGIGRNLLYRKSLFSTSGLLQDFGHLKGGDDDLLVNRMANAQNTTIALDSETLMYSTPKLSFNSYWVQKTRHLQIGKYYRKKDHLVLGLFSLSLCGLWVSGIAIHLFNINNWGCLIVLLSFLLIKLYLSHKITLNLGLRLSLAELFLMDLLFIAYNGIFLPIALAAKSVNWK